MTKNGYMNEFKRWIVNQVKSGKACRQVNEIEAKLSVANRKQIALSTSKNPISESEIIQVLYMQKAALSSGQPNKIKKIVDFYIIRNNSKP